MAKEHSKENFALHKEAQIETFNMQRKKDEYA